MEHTLKNSENQIISTELSSDVGRNEIEDIAHVEPESSGRDDEALSSLLLLLKSNTGANDNDVCNSFYYSVKLLKLYIKFRVLIRVILS
jgi:hypothetical protein